MYASDTYYNLTESQLRSIERIEETYLRKVLKTTKGCPIVQMYLEMGQWPARFEIQKLRLLFLKSILQQDENGMVFKFFKLQLEQPTRGDWVSSCKTDLKELGITQSLREIKEMPKNRFKNMLNLKVKENALEYLLGKRGSKGKEMNYPSLEMADYLLPYNDKMDIEEKQRLFAVKNRMVEIPSNFGKSDSICICGTKENMSHIYSCQYLNEKKESQPYGNVQNGKLNEQIEIFRRFENNMKERNKIKMNLEVEKVGQIRRFNKHPCDPSCDPLNFVQSSIG